MTLGSHHTRALLAQCTVSQLDAALHCRAARTTVYTAAQVLMSDSGARDAETLKLIKTESTRL